VNKLLLLVGLVGTDCVRPTLRAGSDAIRREDSLVGCRVLTSLEPSSLSPTARVASRGVLNLLLERAKE
jgi:hypothetical protein